MGYIGTQESWDSALASGINENWQGNWTLGEGGGTDPIDWNVGGENDYNTEQSGSLSYDAIHPPKPDMSGTAHPNLANAVLDSATYTDSLKGLANYWAGEVGDDDYAGADDFAADSGYQNTFKTDAQGWRDDWGTDPSWKPGATPDEDAWKKHGGKRDQTVDLPFITEAETKFKSLETAIGYNSDTDLIGEVFPGYGSEVDADALQERGDDPAQVIGVPDEETGELDSSGELARNEDASGAWGQYLTGVKHIKETYDQDKGDAKEDYEAELKSVKAQKKALGSGVAPGLRESVKKGAITGLRRGGRRAGGYGRGDTESIQAKAKELGGLREKARSAYNRKLERLVIDKKQDIDVKVNTLTNKVETEFTELAGDIQVAKNEYQSDNLTLEDSRSDNIYDLFQMYESTDPAEPWPRDPDRVDEE